MATENSKPMVPNMVTRLAPEFGWPDTKIKVRELVDASTPYTPCHLREFTDFCRGVNDVFAW
jgi:hypothetical protein